MKKKKVKYAVPCAFTTEGDFDVEDVFFLTFHTKDEDEAFKLAQCICGKKAAKALCIISEDGELFQL